MKRKIVLLNACIVLALVFLAGCSITKEEAVELAKEAFEAGLVADVKKANAEGDLFSYYLPVTLDVAESAENNLILKKGEQPYLIFCNPAEDSASQVNYEQDLAMESDAIFAEAKEVEGKFGYIIISPYDEKTYKVIVGIGGEKGSTLTDLPNLKANVETLLEIIKSINY